MPSLAAAALTKLTLAISVVVAVVATPQAQWLASLPPTATTPLQQSAPSLVPEHTRQYIADTRTRWGVPGLAIAVVSNRADQLGDGDGDWASEVLSFGSATASGDNVTDDTLFALASNSKLFTAISIGLLIDNHTVLPNGAKLDYDTKLKDILPEWKLKDGYASDHVDVLDLLTMRSGLPAHQMANDMIPPSDVIANLRNLRPSTELRRSFQYNNYHYITLSHIVTALSGTPYIDFVREHVLDPLGMTATTFNGTAARETGVRSDGFVSEGINATRCAERWTDVDHLDPSCTGVSTSVDWWTDTDGIVVAGPGGLISSGNDMVKWVRELLDPHPRVIPRHLIEAVGNAHQVMFPISPFPELGVLNYGLGQWTSTYRGERVVTHTGGVPGHTSLLIRLPDRGLGIAVLVNDASLGSLLHTVAAYRIIDDMLGFKPISWDDRYLRSLFFASDSYPELPRHPAPPPGGFEAVPGVYSDQGYGVITLIPVASAESLSEVLSTMSMTDTGIVGMGMPPLALPQALSRTYLPSGSVNLNNPPLNVTGPIFLAPFPKSFASHLLFTHFSGSLFNWTAIFVMPQNARRPAPVIIPVGVGPAVIESDGIAMHNFWSSAPNVPASKINIDNPKEGAEVWFEREIW